MRINIPRPFAIKRKMDGTVWVSRPDQGTGRPKPPTQPAQKEQSYEWWTQKNTANKIKWRRGVLLDIQLLNWVMDFAITDRTLPLYMRSGQGFSPGVEREVGMISKDCGPHSLTVCIPWDTLKA